MPIIVDSVQPCKGCGAYVITLTWTPLFEWYIVEAPIPEQDPIINL